MHLVCKLNLQCIINTKILGIFQPSVYQIELEKPVSGGLGISLVTAESRNQTGVFIRTITPGGAADVDGRLEEGDKILQVTHRILHVYLSEV